MKTLQNFLTDYAAEITTQKVKKKSSRRYTQKFKVAAVKLLKRKGTTSEEVATALDVNNKTLQNWVNDQASLIVVPKRIGKPKAKKALKTKVVGKIQLLDKINTLTKTYQNKLNVVIQQLHDLEK